MTIVLQSERDHPLFQTGGRAFHNGIPLTIGHASLTGDDQRLWVMGWRDARIQANTESRMKYLESFGPRWRVHTALLLAEVLQNPNMWALRQPILIFDGLLREIAARAGELGDPILNRLMMQLTLYAVADPHSPDHNPEVVNSYLYGDDGKADD